MGRTTATTTIASAAVGNRKQRATTAQDKTKVTFVVVVAAAAGEVVESMPFDFDFDVNASTVAISSDSAAIQSSAVQTATAGGSTLTPREMMVLVSAANDLRMTTTTTTTAAESGGNIAAIAGAAAAGLVLIVGLVVAGYLVTRDDGTGQGGQRKSQQRRPNARRGSRPRTSRAAETQAAAAGGAVAAPPVFYPSSVGSASRGSAEKIHEQEVVSQNGVTILSGGAGNVKPRDQISGSTSKPASDIGSEMDALSNVFEAEHLESVFKCSSDRGGEEDQQEYESDDMFFVVDGGGVDAEDKYSYESTGSPSRWSSPKVRQQSWYADLFGSSNSNIFPHMSDHEVEFESETLAIQKVYGWGVANASTKTLEVDVVQHAGGGASEAAGSARTAAADSVNNVKDNDSWGTPASVDSEDLAVRFDYCSTTLENMGTRSKRLHQQVVIEETEDIDEGEESNPLSLLPRPNGAGRGGPVFSWDSSAEPNLNRKDHSFYTFFRDDSEIIIDKGVTVTSNV